VSAITVQVQVQEWEIELGRESHLGSFFLSQPVGMPDTIPIVVWGPKVKVVYPHGYGYSGIRKRVSYQIEKHTTNFVRCLKHPKPRVESNASLYKAGDNET
jgi:hypothetical protein